MKPILSIQLWSGRFAGPLPGVLETIAEVGYDAVETYTALFRSDPEAFRKQVDQAGLSISSAHMELADILSDTSRCAATADILGIRHVFVPHLAEGQEVTTAEGWIEVGTLLSEAADQFGRYGLSLGWSNHGHEFMPLPTGELPIDLILRSANVAFEAEFGWLQRTGANALEQIARYGQRMSVVRVKDFTPEGDLGEDGWADVGYGIGGYDRLWPNIRTLPHLHAVVIDHNHPSDFARFARRSLETVKAFERNHADA